MLAMDVRTYRVQVTWGPNMIIDSTNGGLSDVNFNHITGITSGGNKHIHPHDKLSDKLYHEVTKHGSQIKVNPTNPVKT